MKRSKTTRPKDCPYVGKGGLKLEFGLDFFQLDVSGLIAADLGCHIGGFTDCLLQRGAAKVYAVDTAYGLLAWKLRNDLRVVVCERTNALHWTAPEPLDFIAGDLGWTKQQHALPVIARLLHPNGMALSLIKPQYEAPKDWGVHGVLPEERLPEILAMVRAGCPAELTILGEARTPYPGSGGNIEYWLLVTRQEAMGA